MGKRVARTRAGGEWTEARYWTFIRTGLRQMSRRYPPIARQVLNQARRSSQSANKRLKWEYQCKSCENWFPRKEVNLDHIEPCGKMVCLDDLAGYVGRMFCEPDGLQVLCTECHKSKQ